MYTCMHCTYVSGDMFSSSVVGSVTDGHSLLMHNMIGTAKTELGQVLHHT